MTMIGQTLAHYEIPDKLGSGGMGVVYRARDTKLKRDVAIKVLPEAYASDRERMARFEREAQVLASLNHPNIASIYGLEKYEGVFALVLELVEGQTLEERIERGPIDIEQAIAIAKQIAEGLEAAHGKGIIHRDLKPANAMITEDGTVKLLHFGLAKALEGDTSESIDDSKSPTLSRRATQAGVLLGTAGYMSPEQARGKPVDKRTDIWALGVVLFEMLTGKRLFHGETVSDTLAAVLKTEPDWAALPADTPWLLKRLLRRCLEKNRSERLHDAADVRLELQDTLTTRDEVLSDSRRSRSRVTVAVGALVVGLAFGVAIMSRWLEREPEPPIRFSMEVPEINMGGRQVTLSQDGRSLALGGRLPSQVFHLSLGALDEEAPSPIAGGRSPFFSPDGRWIGFVDENTLKKVASSGGEPVSICECGRHSYVWSEDDLILFMPPEGLMRVSANGGEPERVFPDDDAAEFKDPQLLPGKKTLLATEAIDGATWVISLSLTTRERTRLVQGHSAQYVEPGYLIFARSGLQTTTLFATAFDADALELRGDIISIADDVINRRGGKAAQFSVSRTGTLVYASWAAGFAERGIVWIDRSGLATTLIDDAAAYRYPRLSPDGSLLAYTTFRVGRTGLWVYDLARGARTLVQEGVALDPAWTPDGQALTFTLQTVSDGFAIYSKAPDGSGDAKQLVVAEDRLAFEASWSPDGRVLYYHNGIEIWALSDAGEVAALVMAEATVKHPRVSPNGRWVAYVSDTSGQDEVYVVPSPEADRRFTISTDGGDSPVWSRDGRELFYTEGDRLMAVAVETAGEFRAKTPQELFQGNLIPSTNTNYDVSLDGKRFVAVQSANMTESLHTVLHFVIHFDEELRQRLP